MAEYEHSQTIAAPPDEVFAFVSDVSNLPQYLPTTKAAQPQGGERVRVQGEAASHRYDADGYVRADRAAQRLGWGADEPDRYSGWLSIAPDGDTSSSVTVHLSFGPNMGPPPGADPNQGPDEKDKHEGIQASLMSIKNLVEGRGGKVEPPAAT